MAISPKLTLILLLVLVQGSINSQAKTVEELIELANNVAEAPFTPDALEKMNNDELWGAKRADRTDDIVIINTSGQSFSSVFHTCDFGALSPGLLPEERMDAHTSTVLGAQSSKDDEYANVDCLLSYALQDQKTYFHIALDSNSRGDIDVNTRSSQDLSVFYIVDKGENNQVIIRVMDREE